MRHLMNKRGFTLVEIMIVVAIIILLAAIAIPNLLRARHNANEAAAIASMRTLSTAFESYRAAHTPAAYPATPAVLSAETPPYIDATLGTGVKQGYGFVASNVVLGNTYTITATPTTIGTTGTRIFSVNQDGVIMDVGAGLPIE